MLPSLLTVTQQSELFEVSEDVCMCVCVCVCGICLIVLGLFIFKYTRDSFFK